MASKARALDPGAWALVGGTGLIGGARSAATYVVHQRSLTTFHYNERKDYLGMCFDFSLMCCKPLSVLEQQSFEAL